MEQHDQNQYQQHLTHQTDNLNTLAILHLVKAILAFLFSLFFVFYMFMGTFVGKMIEMNPEADPAFNVSIVFWIIGGIGMVFSIIFGILNLLSYQYLNKKKNYTFIFAVAIINCLTGILGILLGVFTLVEISKPHVKGIFEKNSL